MSHFISLTQKWNRIFIAASPTGKKFYESFKSQIFSRIDFILWWSLSMVEIWCIKFNKWASSRSQLLCKFFKITKFPLLWNKIILSSKKWKTRSERLGAAFQFSNIHSTIKLNRQWIWYLIWISTHCIQSDANNRDKN